MAITLQQQARSPVKEKREDFSLRLTDQLTNSIHGLIKPVKSSELLFFTSQLSLMIEIETPLISPLSP